MIDDQRLTLQSPSSRDKFQKQKPRYEPQKIHKKRINTKVHLAVKAHDVPIRAIMTKNNLGLDAHSSLKKGLNATVNKGLTGCKIKKIMDCFCVNITTSK